MKAFFEKTPYLAFIGAAFLLLTSLGAFLWAAMQSLNTLWLIFSSAGLDPSITTGLVQVVDSFLLAIALLIFSLSLYDLCIASLHVPEWMIAHNLHELKAKLSSIIVLVMAAKFLEYLLDHKGSQETLYFAISITLVSAALIAFGYFGKKD